MFLCVSKECVLNICGFATISLRKNEGSTSFIKRIIIIIKGFTQRHDDTTQGAQYSSSVYYIGVRL